MNWRIISFLLILVLVGQPVLAATEEACTLNAAQEIDIVFWQTLPFAVLWSNVLERQLGGILYPGVSARWDVIMILAVGISLTNAVLHTQQAISD